MTWTYTLYAGILHATAMISTIVGFMALRRRNTVGAGKLALLLFAISEWALTSGLESSVIGIQNKIFWSIIAYLGAASSPILFLLFTLEYSHNARWLKPLNLVLISIVPICGFIVASTKAWRGLIWPSFTPSPMLSNVLIFGHGFGYYFLIVYDYLIISTGIITLLVVWYQAKQPYRRQFGLLLLGSLFPFVGGIIISFIPDFLPGLDVTPVAFLLSSLVIAFGILKLPLFDLTPVTHDILMEYLDEGILIMDLQNRVVEINPAAQKILGASAKENLGQPITKVLKSWPLIAKRLDTKKIETEFRLGTNPPRQIHLNVSPLYGELKQITGSMLVFRDVTRRQQAEAELAHNNEEMGIINHISLAATYGLDMEHVLKTLHEQCSQVVPIDIFYIALYDEANSLIHIPLFYERGHYQAGPSRFINDRPRTIGEVIRTRKTLYLNNTVNPDTRPLESSLSKFDKPTRSSIGIPLTIRERLIGVMSIQNYHPYAYTENHVRILERIGIQAAIAVENARLYSEVQRLAIIDELTGIYNYRGLQELGAREVERAYRFHRPLSALFFDIDNFRNFNNTYSHSTGNIILKVISERCRSILRTVDVLARYGGDEFVALLPETDITSAEAVARRMVDEISYNKIVTPFGELGVSISIGVTGLSEDKPNLSALIDRANCAEHQAKQGQKGIIVVAR